VRRVKKVIVVNVVLSVNAVRRVKEAIPDHKDHRVPKVYPEKGEPMEYKERQALKAIREIVAIREMLAILDHKEKRVRREIPAPKDLWDLLVRPVKLVLAVLKENEVIRAIQEQRVLLVRREKQVLREYKALKERLANPEKRA
jgi:hypothetical protein